MDKKVYIVHGSAIIQDGLADILRKNFKCTIQCYPDINTLLQTENTPISKGIFFIEDVIAESKEYLQFLHKSHGLKSFSIKNSKPEKILSQSQNTLFLYESPDKIHNQVKHLFNDPEHIENEPDELTNREIDVLKLAVPGYSNKEIADK